MDTWRANRRKGSIQRGGRLPGVSEDIFTLLAKSAVLIRGMPLSSLSVQHAIANRDTTGRHGSHYTLVFRHRKSTQRVRDSGRRLMKNILLGIATFTIMKRIFLMLFATAK